MSRIVFATCHVATHTEGIAALGYRFPPEHAPHFVGITHPQLEAGALHAHLTAARVACCVRSQHVRLGVHFYTRAEDVAALIKHCASALTMAADNQPRTLTCPSL